MSLSTIDFGNSIIPLTGDDAIFLDTNMYIAYFDVKDSKHLPCFCLISYFIKNQVIICYSEIVLVELINSLARMFYIDDEYAKHVATNGEPASNTEKRNKQNSFKNIWSSRVIKSEPETLKHYNDLAINKVSPVVKNALLIQLTEEVVDEVLTTPSETPLASADMMIASTATHFGLPYIFSIDKDMSVANDIDIITTALDNHTFDYVDMLAKLNIVEYLFNQLGEMEFRRKFPLCPVPASQN